MEEEGGDFPACLPTYLLSFQVFSKHLLHACSGLGAEDRAVNVTDKVLALRKLMFYWGRRGNGPICKITTDWDRPL